MADPQVITHLTQAQPCRDSPELGVCTTPSPQLVAQHTVVLDNSSRSRDFPFRPGEEGCVSIQGLPANLQPQISSLAQFYQIILGTDFLGQKNKGQVRFICL